MAGAHSWEHADPADVDEALGTLGVAMLAAGYAVTDVGDTLGAAAARAGRSAASVGAIPSAVLISDPVRRSSYISAMAPGTMLRFDQTQRVGMIAADAAAGRATPGQVCRRVAQAEAMPDRYPVWGLIIGNALVAAGVSMVFRTSWPAVVLDLLLGALVGGIITAVSRVPRLVGLLPFVLGLISAVVVFGSADVIGLPAAPLFAVFAPIVIVVPGAAVTNAVIELAAGDVVSGGGRLVFGLLTWAMLLFGVLLGAAIVGVGPGDLVAMPDGSLPSFAPWGGLLVMSIGIVWSNSAPMRLTPVIVLVLLLAYGIVVLVGSATTTVIGSGVSAAVMLVFTRSLEVRFRQLPAIVTFRPAFWLLVPGSLGLVALTGIAGADASAPQTLAFSVLATVVAISIGVQVGAVISEAILQPRRGAELARFEDDLDRDDTGADGEAGTSDDQQPPVG